MNENNAFDKAIEELKKTTINSTPPQQVIDKTVERLAVLDSERTRIPARVDWKGFLKLAAAAAIILAAGVYAGRLTKSVKIDESQLAAIEKTLKSQIQQELQESLAQDFQSLMAINEAQFNELADSIDESQKWERTLISLVLEQMELNRQTESEELKNSLIDFASQTSEKLTKTEAILEKLTAKNEPLNKLDNQKDNLQ